MSKLLNILIGVILILAPILIVLNIPLFYNWGPAAIEFLKGGVVVCLMIVGIVFLILGITE
ncbi:MAG: hypothetical protein IB618_00690 [Candidatus Pacearchaeota archaeon]|nr:MAG: hypothetical protein IB618_00690 [Candidatus Pacearchaeota archaeon]